MYILILVQTIMVIFLLGSSSGPTESALLCHESTVVEEGGSLIDLNKWLLPFYTSGFLELLGPRCEAPSPTSSVKELPRQASYGTCIKEPSFPPLAT